MITVLFVMHKFFLTYYLSRTSECVLRDTYKRSTYIVTPTDTINIALECSVVQTQVSFSGKQ